MGHSMGPTLCRPDASQGHMRTSRYAYRPSRPLHEAQGPSGIFTVLDREIHVPGETIGMKTISHLPNTSTTLRAKSFSLTPENGPDRM